MGARDPREMVVMDGPPLAIVLVVCQGIMESVSSQQYTLFLLYLKFHVTVYECMN